MQHTSRGIGSRLTLYNWHPWCVLHPIEQQQAQKGQSVSLSVFGACDLIFCNIAFLASYAVQCNKHASQSACFRLTQWCPFPQESEGTGVEEDACQGLEESVRFSMFSASVACVTMQHTAHVQGCGWAVLGCAELMYMCTCPHTGVACSHHRQESCKRCYSETQGRQGHGGCDNSNSRSPAPARCCKSRAVARWETEL